MITYTVLRELTGNDHKLTMTVTSADLLPVEAFLMRYDMDTATDIYSAVCGLPELSQFHSYKQEGTPFFRAAELVKLFHNTTDLEHFITVVDGDLKQLDIDYHKYIQDSKYGQLETATLNEELT